jgi:hypothetical protein
MSGGLAGLLAADSRGASAEPLASVERLLAAAQAGALPVPAEGLHDSKSFWDAFGNAAESGGTSAEPAGVRGRGLTKKPADNSGAADMARTIDFYQYDAKNTTLRFATSITPNELLDHEGDVTASVNVNGFRMAGDDRQTFDKLQSAQLRIDMVQTIPIVQYLEPMAWTSLAALFPNKSGKLPPLQNLSFNPGDTWQKMQQIVLPGGAAQVAINLSMAHKESTFMTILQTLTTEIDKFAPVLGLPAISVTALKGFTSLYGAWEQRTTFLLNSLPVRAFATQAAREAAQTQSGLNLVGGDYVLVPHTFSAALTPYLDKLELRQGYLVPKGTSTNTSVYDVATNLTPDITYLSTTIAVKPATAATPSSSPSKTGAKTPPKTGG